MKKLLALIFALSLVFALAACANSTTTTTEAANSTNSTDNGSKAGENTTEQVKTETFDEFLASLSEKSPEGARNYAVDKVKTIDLSSFNLQEFLTKNVFQASVDVEARDEDGELKTDGEVYYFINTNGPVVYADVKQYEDVFNEDTEEYETQENATNMAVTVTWDRVASVLNDVKEILTLAQLLDYDDLMALVQLAGASNEPKPADGELVPAEEPTPSEGETETGEPTPEQIDAFVAWAENLTLEELGFTLTTEANFTKTADGVYQFNFVSLTDMVYNALSVVEAKAVELEMVPAEDVVEGSHMGITKEQISAVLTTVEEALDFSVLFDGQFKGLLFAVTEFNAGGEKVSGTVKLELGYNGNDLASCSLRADFTADEVTEDTEDEEGELAGHFAGHAYLDLSKDGLTADVNVTMTQGETKVGEVDLDLTIDAKGVNGKFMLNTGFSVINAEVKTSTTEIAGFKSTEFSVNVSTTYTKGEAETSTTVDLFKLTVKTNGKVVLPEAATTAAAEAMDMSEMVKSLQDTYLVPVKEMLKSLTTEQPAE